MTRIHPPGPFPPRHDEAQGAIDLAVRLRAELFTRAWIRDEARPALGGHIQQAAREGDLQRLATCIEDFVATWPVAALLDDARARWRHEGDGEALAVLGRAASLIRRATGWGAQAEGPWPMPDAAWVREQAGQGPFEIVRRDRRDGAPAVADLLDAPLHGEPATPAGCADVPAADLMARRAELGRRLATGDLRAVRVLGAVDPTPEAQLALGELRLEGHAQAAVETFGVAALPVDRVPDFDELLVEAPPGRDGEALSTRCARALFPGTPARLRRGETRPACFLAWDGPHRPLAVDPVVAPALQVAEGGASRGAILEAIDGREDILEELLAVGALDAIAR